MRKMRPTVIGGKASTMRNCTTSVIQTNTGMRISVMPGAAHVEDRDDEVDAGQDRRDAQDLEAQHPEVDVGPGRELAQVRLA